jgi:hypothetical protein
MPAVGDGVEEGTGVGAEGVGGGLSGTGVMLGVVTLTVAEPPDGGSLFESGPSSPEQAATAMARMATTHQPTGERAFL